MSCLMMISYFFTLIVCGFMLFGSVCRVRFLSLKRGGLKWIVQHTLLAAIAAKLMLDLVFVGQSSVVLGVIVGVGDAYLISTWRRWQGGRKNAPIDIFKRQ